MVLEQDVRVRSYFLWQRAGCPQGNDVAFWLRAEAELRAEAGSGEGPQVVLDRLVWARPTISSPPLKLAPRERMAPNAARR
jgi:Protein of unknown function (DUF2934)